MTPLRTAVVGVGAIGSLHARIYSEHPLAALSGVVDTNPVTARAVAERLRVPWFTEVSDLLDCCDFSAASVSVPEHHRYQVAVPLALAGKHLLLEKPLAPTLAGTDRLVTALESTGVLAMVNFILRFDPRYTEAKNAVSSGRLGEVHTIFTRRRASSATADTYGRWTDLLIGAGIHDLDAMAWLAGSPVTRVYAETISRRSAAYGHDDAAMVLVRFENGIIGSLEASWVLPPSIPGPLDASLQVVGTEGGVFIDGANHGLAVVDTDRLTLPDLAHWPVTRGRVSGDLAASLDHCIRSVRDSTPPEMTLAKARIAHAIVDAAKRSARLNQPVELTPPSLMDPWNLARPRIGVASLVQETNTFSPKPTVWEDYTVLVGDDAASTLRRTNTEFAGAFSALRRMGAEPVPLLAAWALPSGKVTDETFARLSALLDDRLEEAGRLEGLVLSLHGAMATESVFDADSALIEIARRRIGAVPLGVCLDLHANVTPRMVELADAVVGYHTEPHIDMASTGKRIARMVTAIAYGEISPTLGLAKRPLLISAEAMRTDIGPMSEVRRLADARSDRHVFDVSLFPVQPWLDVPELGLGVVVTAEADPSGARDLAEELADEIWQRKERMTTPRLMTPDLAFREARNSATRPFIMAHTSDCPTAGAAGDDPVMISEAAAYGGDLVVMHTVLDPSAVSQCTSAVGQRVRVKVGGGFSPAAVSVIVDGIVRRSGAGSYRLVGRSFTRREASMGQWVVLESGFHRLLITSKSAITADRATWRHAGLDPDQADVLVVSSCSDYRANFPSSAPEAVTLDLPGSSTPRLESLRFRHAPRPLYPLDPM